MEIDKFRFRKEVDDLYKYLKIDSMRQNQEIRTTINTGSIFKPLQHVRTSDYSCKKTSPNSEGPVELPPLG